MGTDQQHVFESKPETTNIPDHIGKINEQKIKKQSVSNLVWQQKATPNQSTNQQSIQPTTKSKMLDDLNHQQQHQQQQSHQQQPDPLLSASAIQVPSINDHIDEAPTFLFSVSEPEQKSEGGKLGLSYWSYRITSNVCTTNQQTNKKKV